MIDKKQVDEWKQLVLTNPKRLQEEEEVIGKYGQIFHPSNLDRLTKEDFKSFLVIKNNRHWDGIHRQSNMITENMPRLIGALKILLDETRSLKERLNDLFSPKGPSMIKGLGRAIVTPILLVVYPERYGVFNTKSEAGLEAAGLLPNLKGKSFAERYVLVNEALKAFSKEHGLTLWQTDDILGWLSFSDKPIGREEDEDSAEVEAILQKEGVTDIAEFGLEKFLEDFLVYNWEKTSLGKTYAILEKDGDLIGQQYDTEIVGRIDILAKSKDGKEWLVIELKRGRSSDEVVGQVLRYIGFVSEHLASEGETVKGLIILGSHDDRIRYALKTLPNVSLQTYEVNFKLNNME